MECLPLSDDDTKISYGVTRGTIFDAILSTEKLEITYRGRTYTSTRHRTKKGKMIEDDEIVIMVPEKYKSVTLKCKLELGLRPMSREVAVITYDHIVDMSGKKHVMRSVKYHGTIKKKRWDL